MRSIVVFWLAITALAVAGWITHVVWLFKTLTGPSASVGQAALGVLGAIAPPLGAIHGVWLWFT